MFIACSGFFKLPASFRLLLPFCPLPLFKLACSFFSEIPADISACASLSFFLGIFRVALLFSCQGAFVVTAAATFL